MSVHDYPVWLDVFGPENFSLLVAVEKGKHPIAVQNTMSTKNLSFRH